MSVITKFINAENTKFAVDEIRQYLQDNPTYKGFINSDYKGNLSFNISEKIPEKFLNWIVYISGGSFKQPHKVLSKKIRLYVMRELKNNKIITIGGESYLYGLLGNFDEIIHYTKYPSVYHDCNYNNSIFNKNISNNLVNYNTIDNLPIGDYDILLNLHKLSKNLIKVINKNKYRNLYIISCSHDDFWKKVKLLDNYTLVKRKKFICYKLKYFLTVNTLESKN